MIHPARSGLHPLLIVLCAALHTGAVQGQTNTSLQPGSWHAPATWSLGHAPQPGELARVQHALSITQAVDFGDSTMIRTNAPASLKLEKTGWLTVGTGVTMTVRGHVELNSTLLLQAGATLCFSATAAADPEAAHYWLKIWPDGTNHGRLAAQGTAEQPCVVTAAPPHRASIIGGYNLFPVSTNNGLINYSPVSDGGQIDAAHTLFTGLGDGMFPAWSYRPGSTGGVYRLADCGFNHCGRVVVNSASPLGGSIVSSFERVRWTDSVPKDPLFQVGGYWGILQTCGATGALTTCRLSQCDVDQPALLWNLNGYTVEDCVFRDNVDTRASPIAATAFRRNFMRFTANDRFISRFGSRIEDCLIIHDYETQGNPHMHQVTKGTGTGVLHGCVFWFSSTNVWPDGGDGTFVKNADSGTRDENTLLIEQCLYLPNGRGPDQSANLSCNITSGGLESTNARVIVRRNTAFSQGVSIGETLTTRAGALRYVKSNLIVGPTNFTGTKINDYGQGETNAVAAADADYNAGYRLATGSCYIAQSTGKGYHQLKLAGDLLVGRHDLDDVDPQFVDPGRTPRTWSLANGGDGSMADVADRLQPAGSHTIQTLLDYLRAGFQPRNPRLKRAGDPAEGSPDIGAVDLPADSDGDTVPDNDEFGSAVFSIGVDDRLADADGDGLSNASEYVAGTDPDDGQTFFTVTASTQAASCEIAFTSVTGRLYQINFTTNLLAPVWEPLPGMLTGTNNRLTFLDANLGTGPKFYRGQVALLAP